MDIQTIDAAQQIFIKNIEPTLANQIWQSMQTNVPDWLIKQENINLAKPCNRLYFAAMIADKYVGLLAIELATVNNAHIHWIIVDSKKQLDVIGAKLLLAAENYCYAYGYSSLTVATLSPNQVKTDDRFYHHFYEEHGYQPLFEMTAVEAKLPLLYLHKIISLNQFTFIDLTHPLSATVPHWGVDVGFKYNARYIQSADSNSNVKFRVQRLEMSSGIGTHMDAPSHCFEQLSSIDSIPMPSLITIGRVIDVSSKVHDKYSVSVEDVLHFEEQYGLIPNGAFVIIHTGWDKRWNEPEKYRNEKIFPHLSIEAAKLLLSREIVGIGIDTLSPDAFGSDFPVHQLILGAGKYIIENVANANQLDPADSYIFALPMKIVDGTESPMRLVGMKRKRWQC